MGTRPAYSLTSTKVGLVARTLAPRPRTSPCTKQVLPAPSSPVSAMTAPGPSVAPSRSPAASVVSALGLTISPLVATEPRESLGDGRDQIARDQRFLAEALGGHVPGAPVQVDGREQRRAGLEPARQKGAEHARERVAGAARRHAGIARRIHEDAPVRGADHAPGPLQQEMHAIARREFASDLDPVALDLRS